MYEWLMGFEYDVYHSMIYFSLYLNYEKLYEVVDIDVNVDNRHDYVLGWLWWCLLIIMMMLVELLCWRCWWIIYVYVHMCCWWSSYMLLVMSWWCKYVLKYVDDDLLCMNFNYLTMQWGANHEDGVYII